MKMNRLLYVSLFVLLLSCDEIHDELYGEQKITITNSYSFDVRITIESVNYSDSQTLGTVKSKSTRVFNLDWRNDCNYFFTASYANSEVASSKMNVCGGAIWEL